MRIITRYVLREYLIPLGYCLSAFCLIYLIYDLFDRFTDLLEAQVSLWQVFLFYVHYLFAVNGFVPFIVMVMPIALLLSELYTLVTFARHNELTAMRATGMSLYRLMFPFLTIGLLASIVALAIQEGMGPYATQWTKKFEGDINKKKPEQAYVQMDFLYHTGVSQRHWLIRWYDTRTPNKGKEVKVTQDRKDGSLQEEYTASRVEWLDDAWWFYDLQVKRYDLRGEPIGGLGKPSLMPVELRDFKESPDDFMQELNKTDTLSSWEMYKYVKMRPNLSKFTRTRRMVDLHARMAMPWTCLVVILIGMPAVMTSSRKGALLTVLIAIAFMFLFYFFVHLGMILGKRELIAPWLAGWLPNVVFSVVGILSLFRIKS